ncbi:hypothetical protein K7X08_004552 [Anisodus acutangulus]|uniref:Uncharacterized protein n=1 Tax=Anisodus acutangulus TaxID=402998 RepID=A0A9Q1MDT4_9SOLA|nr:hypothetical protein K7X08_004552 [Anisodus acutangulus]
MADQNSSNYDEEEILNHDLQFAQRRSGPNTPQASHQDVPDDCGFVRELVRRRLMVLRESLAMMVSVEDGSRDKISGLKPYSWTKEFIKEPFSKMTIPLGMWNADKLLVVVLQTRALK